MIPLSAVVKCDCFTELLKVVITISHSFDCAGMC